MSGRGRGGRGGRGGWRGRGGRGNGPQRLTDEDGAEVLGFEEGGPPKLFPVSMLCLHTNWTTRDNETSGTCTPHAARHSQSTRSAALVQPLLND